MTHNGAHGWVLLASLVTVWDVAAVVAGGESLSSSFRRALAHPAARWQVTAAVAYLTAHLYAPPAARRFDPLCRAAGLLERACHRGA